jgi:hypothetical protein
LEIERASNRGAERRLACLLAPAEGLLVARALAPADEEHEIVVGAHRLDHGVVGQVCLSLGHVERAERLDEACCDLDRCWVRRGLIGIRRRCRTPADRDEQNDDGRDTDDGGDGERAELSVPCGTNVSHLLTLEGARLR